MFILHSSTLPLYFESISLTPLSDIHKHSTRHKHHIVRSKVKPEIDKKSIRYDIPKRFIKGPYLIIDKIVINIITQINAKFRAATHVT